VGTWSFRLYVAGSSPRSLRAVENLHRLLDELLPGCHVVEVVDLLEEPGRAREDDVLAVPTLVRADPQPLRRVIGDLSDREQVVQHLDLPRR
jgi:circadian clock protein KaiB